MIELDYIGIRYHENKGLRAEALTREGASPACAAGGLLFSLRASTRPGVMFTVKLEERSRGAWGGEAGEGKMACYIEGKDGGTPERAYNASCSQ